MRKLWRASTLSDGPTRLVAEGKVWIGYGRKPMRALGRIRRAQSDDPVIVSVQCIRFEGGRLKRRRKEQDEVVTSLLTVQARHYRYVPGRQSAFQRGTVLPSPYLSIGRRACIGLCSLDA